MNLERTRAFFPATPEKLPRVLTCCFLTVQTIHHSFLESDQYFPLQTSHLQTFMTFAAKPPPDLSRYITPTLLSDIASLPLPQEPHQQPSPPNDHLPRIQQLTWLGFLKAFKHNDNLHTVACVFSPMSTLVVHC